jgi:predicted dehydrogenase
VVISERRQAAVGIIGCGSVLRYYLAGMSRFGELRVAGCADAIQSRADEAGRRFGVRAYASVAALLGDPDVDVVLNITSPLAHAGVSVAAMRAGKHVYSEKPLAASAAGLGEVVAVQAETGRGLGCAPDTILGPAAQTARAAVDSALIGDPIGAAAFITSTRPEEWHPDPRFLFAPGGGPVLDLGPYYIASLVNCLGPLASVAAMARVGQTPRTLTAPGRAADAFDVTVATHVSATLRFASGVIGTALMSFDMWSQDLPFLEIYGSAGRLRLPDPNGLDGDVLVKLKTDDDWTVIDPVFGPAGQADAPAEGQMLRGAGVADLVRSLDGAPQRLSAEFGAHVCEALHAIGQSGQQRAEVSMTSTCRRPAPLARAMTDLAVS